MSIKIKSQNQTSFIVEQLGLFYKVMPSLMCEICNRETNIISIPELTFYEKVKCDFCKQAEMLD